MKRLIKKAVNIKDELGIDTIGESNRDCAGIYYNGKLWTGNQHYDIISQIEQKYFDADENDMAFLHIKNIDGTTYAFVEDATIVPYNKIVSAVRKKYPNASVYTRSMSNGREVQKVAKRLIKKAFMDIEVLKGTLEQLSDEGRDILRAIEDYKFKLEQASRVVANDQMLAQKINQKQKILDAAAGQIYGIVFDIENIDITQAYTDQQMMATSPGLGEAPDGEATPTPMPGQPGQPPVPGQAPGAPGEGDDADNADDAPAGGGGAPIPQGGSAAPAPKDDEEDSDSDDDSKDDKDDKDSGDDEDLKEEDLPEEPDKKD